MKITKTLLERMVKDELINIKEATERWDPESPSRPGGPEDPATMRATARAAISDNEKKLGLAKARIDTLLSLFGNLNKERTRETGQGLDEIWSSIEQMRQESRAGEYGVASHEI